MQRSAESQDGVALMYEEVALGRVHSDKYREHAARHSEFAHQDRRMAEQLRRLAGS